MLKPPRLTVAELDALPALLAVKDLAPIWNVSIARAHELDREGAFDFLRVKPPIGPLKFSGRKLRQYLDPDGAASRLPKVSNW